MSEDAQFDHWKRAFDNLTSAMFPAVVVWEPADEDDDSVVDDDSDIVARLRYNGSLSDGFMSREAREAADVIDQLRAHLEDRDLRLESERRLSDSLAAQLMRAAFTNDEDAAAAIAEYREARRVR